MALDERFESTELHKLLRVVEHIRILQEPGDVKFPDMVMCGVQSSGKSSVLQGLAGVNLPRRKEITTRVALQLNLVVDSDLPEGQAYALISSKPDLERTGKRFEEEQMEDLGEEIERITTILAGESPRVEPDGMIYLRMVRARGPTMTLVDLPGISYKDENLTMATKECFRRRFSDPDNENIILLVKTAASDVESDPATEEAKRVDPDGKRTICVLTNMDRPFNPDNIDKTVKKLAEEAKAGVFPVFNPDRLDLTPTEARQEEEAFFRERSQVCTLYL